MKDFHCNNCDREFDTKPALVRHYRNAHKSDGSWWQLFDMVGTTGDRRTDDLCHMVDDSHKTISERTEQLNQAKHFIELNTKELQRMALQLQTIEQILMLGKRVHND